MVTRDQGSRDISPRHLRDIDRSGIEDLFTFVTAVGESEYYSLDMSRGSAARNRRAEIAKQSSPDDTGAPEQPSDNDFASLSERDEE